MSLHVSDDGDIIAQQLQALGNLKRPKKKTSSIPLLQFSLPENNDERRLTLVGENVVKNPTHICNHCNTFHFFLLER